MRKLLSLLVILACASGCWTRYGIVKGEAEGEYILLETRNTPFSSSALISEWKYEIDAEGQPHLTREYILFP